ncbi:MAG: ABC transporter substrate-binding protein [Rhodobacterales bacterium]|nr:ABC transporter substrate-binding protein [Rhodobacterales bacterium]NCT13453.1 ABC transporter substrate-binding protein [Rhodobacterales bacterium]
MTIRKLMLGAVAGAALLAGQAAVAQVDEITVAYFLEWPMPFQYAKVQGLYEEAMGVKINWVSFDTGTAMSAAMASGDVQLAVSQGVPPFVVATSAGQDLVTLDVAVSYADNDNCVVASGLEIDQSNAAELAGKKVAVPLGTAAHYGFLRQMDHFGVELASLEIVDMAPPDGAAAIAQGAVDMFCGWGGSLRRAKEFGNVLLTGAEKEALGILVFDVTSAPAGFVAENPDLVAQFLAVTAAMNDGWNDGSMVEAMIPVIAQDSGMDEAATRETMATFVFPSIEDQLSDRWLGAAAPAFMAGVAGVFVESGSIPAALDTYAGAINTGPLAAAGAM